MEYVYDAVDDACSVGLVFLDVSNAFPTVNHRILLRKLQCYGFGNSVIKWFESYLGNRVSRIDKAGSTAQFVTPGLGVPQGSVLGPFLFNVYVNDCVNAVAGGEIVQYADDTVLLIKSKETASAFSAEVERVVAAALKWYDVNRLGINVRKTTCMIFGKLSACVSGFKIGNEFVLKSDHAIYLGLRIDSRLQWSVHINYVVSRIRQVRIMLSRFSHLFDRSLRIYLCKAILFPIVNLYDFIYGVASVKCLRHLNSAYNQLMRTVVGIRRSEHVKIADLCRISTFEPLSTRRRVSLLKFMSDVESESQYCKIRHRFIKARHNYGTRSYDNYIIPSSRTALGQLRVSVRGLRLLNDTKVSHLPM